MFADRTGCTGYLLMLWLVFWLISLHFSTNLTALEKATRFFRHVLPVLKPGWLPPITFIFSMCLSMYLRRICSALLLNTDSATQLWWFCPNSKTFHNKTSVLPNFILVPRQTLKDIIYQHLMPFSSGEKCLHFHPLYITYWATVERKNKIAGWIVISL